LTFKPTQKPTSVNIQVREYLGNGKYGPSRSLTLYNISTDEAYNRIEAQFKEENHEGYV